MFTDSSTCTLYLRCKRFIGDPRSQGHLRIQGRRTAENGGERTSSSRSASGHGTKRWAPRIDSSRPTQGEDYFAPQSMKLRNKWHELFRTGNDIVICQAMTLFQLCLHLDSSCCWSADRRACFRLAGVFSNFSLTALLSFLLIPLAGTLIGP